MQISYLHVNLQVPTPERSQAHGTHCTPISGARTLGLIHACARGLLLVSCETSRMYCHVWGQVKSACGPDLAAFSGALKSLSSLCRP